MECRSIIIDQNFNVPAKPLRGQSSNMDPAHAQIFTIKDILRATIFVLWLLLSDQWFAVVLCKKVEQPDDRPLLPTKSQFRVSGTVDNQGKVFFSE